MKRHFILILTAALLTSGTMMAQQHRRGHGNKDMNPKERAERMTERMVKEYKLSDKQKQQLQELNLKMTEEQKAQAEERRAKMEKQREAQKAKFEAMKAKREAYDAELQKIMSKEQFKAYKENQKKRGEKGRRPGGPRGGHDHRANHHHP